MEGNDRRKVLQTKARNGYLDFVKGIATFLVIWGHALADMDTGHVFSEIVAGQIIYSFHMPLFFIIGGYLLYFSVQRHSTRDLLVSRLKSLIWPLAVWGLGIRLPLNAIRHVITGSPFRYTTPISWVNAFTGPWFIWTFFCLSIYIILAAKAPSRKTKIAAVLFGGVILMLVPGRGTNILHLPDMLLGYWIGRYDILHKVKERFDSSQKKAGGLIICLAIYAAAFGTYMGTGSYTNEIFSLKNSIGGTIGRLTLHYVYSFAGVLLVMVLLLWIYTNVKDGRFSRLMRFTGTISLQSYLIQGYLMESLIPKCMGRIIDEKGYNPIYPNQAVYTLATFFASAAVMLVIQLFMYAVSADAAL